MRDFRLKVWHCSALLCHVLLMNAIHFWSIDKIDCAVLQLIAGIMWFGNAIIYYKRD